MAKSSAQRIGELEDEIKRRNERIEELREDVDNMRDLNRRMEENISDAVAVIEAWKEAFGMEMTDDGGWTWAPFWKEHDKLIADYNALVRDFNRYAVQPGPVGRPLAASEAQCTQVFKLRKAGRSLRGIAEDMSLTLSTVRTIVAKGNGTDRTTKKHRRRVETGHPVVTAWSRQKRTGASLPRRAQAVVDTAADLLKEAKGLGRAR